MIQIYSNRRDSITSKGNFTMIFSQVDYKVLAERLAKKLEDQGERRFFSFVISEHGLVFN